VATPMKVWLDEVVSKYQDKSISDISNLYFMRDPVRPQYSNLDFFYSPADGIILYQTQVEDDGVFLEVKGENYTIQDLTQVKNFPLPCLVVGVFMTFYSVHINRIPYSGRLVYEYLEPIYSKNIPMLLVEKALMEARVDLTHLQYLKVNERVLNTIYSGKIDYEYYVVQIADEDVSAIMPFEQDQNEFYSQNERFSLIRWGSQVDLILPLDPRFTFEFMQNTTDSVCAGLDHLVRITRN
jgi:phosphatidylserine decarboxylase